MNSHITSLAQPVKRTSSGKDASNRAPTDYQQGLASSVDLQLHVTDSAPAQEVFNPPCTSSPYYPSSKVWNALNIVVEYAMEHASTHEDVAAWYQRAYDEALIYRRHKRPSVSDASIISTYSSTSLASQNSIGTSATSYSNRTSYSKNAYCSSDTSPTTIGAANPFAFPESVPCPNLLPVHYSRSRAPSTSSEYGPRTPIVDSTSTSPHIPRGPIFSPEAEDLSSYVSTLNWPVDQQYDTVAETLPAPPKFFCTHPDCKTNEIEGFSTKDIWINHEKTIHETLEQYRCNQCDLVFRLRKRLRLHHKDTHSCTGVSPTPAESSGNNRKKARCSHAEDLRVRDLPQKGAWGCPYCVHYLPKWEARINHIVKEHYMNHQVTRQNLSYNNEILGLLLQPHVSASWSNLIQNRRFTEINWNNMPISKLKDMKKELEFASPFKSDPQQLAFTAFCWSSLCPQDREISGQPDNNSSNGSRITAIYNPTGSLSDETNDMEDRHHRVDLLRSPIVTAGAFPNSSTSGSVRKKKALVDLNDKYSRPNSQEVVLPAPVNEPAVQSYDADPIDLDQWNVPLGRPEDQVVHPQEFVGYDDILGLYWHER